LSTPAPPSARGARGQDVAGSPSTRAAASGSLHGIAWIAFVMPGCALGLRLRPFFGLDPVHRVRAR
jgi:hypothetical protein